MSFEDKALLLGNAALLVMADGVETEGEKAALHQLVSLLGLEESQARKIIHESLGTAVG